MKSLSLNNPHFPNAFETTFNWSVTSQGLRGLMSVLYLFLTQTASTSLAEDLRFKGLRSLSPCVPLAVRATALQGIRVAVLVARCKYHRLSWPGSGSRTLPHHGHWPGQDGDITGLCLQAREHRVEKGCEETVLEIRMQSSGVVA